MGLTGLLREPLLYFLASGAMLFVLFGAAVLGAVNVPGPPVEAVIALSIVFLARELLRPPDAPATLARRSPWIVAFAFGLLHGLGFAGALTEIGLPERAV
jgi:hypothetical protein